MNRADDRPRFGILVQAVDEPAEFIELVELVESLGYDHLWIADSSLHARCVHVYLTLAAVHSKRLRIGTGITPPATRHPAVNLNSLMTIDELSGGRVVVGVGSGDRPLLELGLRPAKVATVEEVVALWRRLARGEHVTMEGEGFRVEDAHLRRRGNELPIHIAGSGPRMLTLAGRVGDGVLMQVGTHPACVRHALGLVQDGLREAGRGLGDIEVGAMAYGAIRDDGDLARLESRPFAAWVPQTVPQYCELAGIAADDVQAVRDRYQGGELHEAIDAADVVTRGMLDAFTLSGTPDECTVKVRALLDAGVRSLTFFPMGSDRAGSIKSFASVGAAAVHG